jgi:hypothetical protein
MWKIVVTAVSVFMLFGNVMGSQGHLMSPQDYMPREFWSDSNAATEVLSTAVKEVKEQLPKLGIRFEDGSDQDWDYAERIVAKAYPHIQVYMSERNLQAPTKDKVLGSIGIYYKEGNPFELTLYTNTYIFLDYVGELYGQKLY